MSFGGRLSVVLGLLIVVIGFAVWAVIGFLLPQPSTIDFTAAPARGAVDMTVQTVPAIGFGFQPVWVSYLVQNPQGQWIHSTIWKLPAHTRINVTLDQYDSGSPLRNQNWGRVQGTIGGQATYNGKPFSATTPTPATGWGTPSPCPPSDLSVPLVGVNPNATNTCGAAPCSHQIRPQHHEVLVRDARTRAVTTGSASSPAEVGTCTGTVGP